MHMRNILTREQVITTIVHFWLQSGIIRSEELEQTVITLNNHSTEDLLHIMLEAAQHHILNGEEHKYSGMFSEQ